MPASQRPSTSLAPRRIKVCSSSSSSIPQPVEEQARKTQLKKVRVICTDPDATESSSDEQDVVCTTGKKRIVREVLIPAALLSWPEEVAGNNATVLTNGRDNEPSHTSASSAFSFSRKSISSRCSSKRSSKKWRLRHITKREQQAGSANEYSEQRNGDAGRYIGVRQRRWGKWTAELREPSQGVRMWLGTFDSAKEAAIAYDEAARQVKGAEAVTNFCTAAAASDATFGDSCWPLYSSTEELLCCSELHGMEDCLLAYSPSSVLDLPTSLDGGSPSPSPSSLLDPAYSDDCGSPLQQLDQALADVEAQADMGASAYQEFGMVLGEECNMQLESAASTAEPLYESFGKLGDYGEACHMGHEDVFLCHEFASCGGFSEDETANLMSFELDAEALTWIDIQP